MKSALLSLALLLLLLVGLVCYTQAVTGVCEELLDSLRRLPEQASTDARVLAQAAALSERFEAHRALLCIGVPKTELDCAEEHLCAMLSHLEANFSAGYRAARALATAELSAIARSQTLCLQNLL